MTAEAPIPAPPVEMAPPPLVEAPPVGEGAKEAGGNVVAAAPVRFCTVMKFAATGSARLADLTKFERLKPMRASLILAKAAGMAKSLGWE